MPLVLVSVDYMRACGAKVNILNDRITETPNLKRKEGFVRECSFDDGGLLSDYSASFEDEES